MNHYKQSISIPGYHITQQLYCSNRTQVYRGLTSTERTPIVLKLLLNEYPTFSELLRFRNQYTIGKNLDHPGVIKHLKLENYGNGFVLVMEDFGGVSLSEYFANTAEQKQQNFNDLWMELCPVAIQITETLEKLYRQRVIHKDIKPKNILIAPKSKQVKLIDFSSSSLLPKESQEIANPNVLEGTLAYMSPEQTGRMNRGIDYRTDFYSLGVTLYELLTGQLPFQSTDLMELVHCHIARQAIAPIEINPVIPRALNDLVMKLMAKTGEERYQSAFGIKYDLQIIWEAHSTRSKIVDFQIGERDICDRFAIPEKLYGRENEVKTLLAAFDRVANPPQPLGGVEIVLVTGYSGIGKTAVINEVHKPIVRQRGYFIKGKYDQFNRDIPFSAWVQAFQDLMRQLLGESDSRVLEWQNKILQALGENGQVIIEVIPELELLIGKQPPVLELEGSAAQNRFNLLFSKFIKVFAAQEYPLVIFLDDLQWADLGSLQLMKLVMAESDARHLLLLGAYRDNEVFPAHPLMLTLDDIRKVQVPIDRITLAPLIINDLNLLVSDALKCPESRAIALTNLVFMKTKGNPFFATQFLKSLHEDGLITFDPHLFSTPLSSTLGKAGGQRGVQGGWQCDIARIRGLATSDDVVEFMASQLQKLPENTQNALKLAACIGNQFDLDTLALVREKSPAETAADLWGAVQEGLIIPISEVYKFYQEAEAVVAHDRQDLSIPYKFLHDRVQQAAYFLIPEADKKSIHLKIGQQLLSNICEQKREEKIFDIVNQLNIGAELIISQAEKNLLAELDLIAGKKAKHSTAYAAAFGYLSAGMKLLTADSWETQYRLTLALYDEAAESAYLKGDFQQTENLGDIILQNATNLLDKFKIYDVWIQQYIARGALKRSIEMGREVLKQLGVEIPQEVKPSDFARGLAEVSSNLAGRKADDLINLPVMQDAHKLAAMQLLLRLGSSTYLAAPELLPSVIFNLVNLSLHYGNSGISAYAYVCYGLLLSGIIRDYNSGYQFGKLALKNLEMFDSKKVKSMVIATFSATIAHWQKHLRSTWKILLDGYQSGVETGSLEYAYRCIQGYFVFCFFAGKELSEFDREIARYEEAVNRLNQESSGININWQTILNLIEPSVDPWHLSGRKFDEVKMLPVLEAKNIGTPICYLYTSKIILLYLFGEYRKAIENAELSKSYLDSAVGLINIAIVNFYDSLARLAIYLDSSAAEQTILLERVRANQEKMAVWAQNAPMNYQHKFDLVAAEINRVLAQNTEAIENYDRAIAGAKANEYTNEEALANELAAKFYLGWGKEKIASVYAIEAYYAYTNWGAKTKVADLERLYPQLLAPILVQKTSNNTSESMFQTIVATPKVTHTSSTHYNAIDLATVLKASQAFTSEIQLDKLLATLMQVVLENAGASKGALILLEADRLAIAATGSVGELTTVLQSIPLEESAELPISLINYAYRTQTTVIIDNARVENNFSADPYIAVTRPKSLLCSLIINQGQLIGILYLENNLTTKAFTAQRLEVLNILCSQAAISIANAKLYKEVTENEKRLTQYLDAIPVGISVHAATGQLNYANQTAQKLLGIEVLPEAKTEQLSQVYQIYCAHTEELYPIEQLPVVRALFGQPATADDLELHQPERNILLEVSSTPILDDTGKIVCAIAAFADITERKQAEKLIAEYNQTLEEEVKDRTAQLAKANQEITALNEMLKAENLRMSAELDVAQQIQQMVLPKSAEVQALEDLEISGFMEPADEVGGDYYDVLYTDRVVTVAIGDVTGHGLESGILMMMTQTAVRTLKEVGEIDYVRFLDTLNCTIYKNLLRMNCDKNLTLAILNYAEGKISISGQHEEIIVVRKGGRIERIDTIDLGFPIGLDDDIADFIGHELVELEPGDGAVLYTDGIPEARNIDRKFYGLERLCEVVAMNWYKTTEEIKQAVIDDLRGFIGEQKVFDDITLVVLKRAG